ncbi:L-rhamnose mutarotase [Enterococcus asini]|uniref:L-rhamnose mutarotase n=1 Tax=Enterococcus asini ATCC 700915 TaxID=1158606 RepID=R2PKT8_9ENTE|nr:L-rhamnose mutarotase [Enterococcus asini]EOH85112.1 L-rhamnose 1-epimerase [Enterococcus asini ATCC 700915]EOT57522.1 L-rhamnose 1-epimerase [Enterococcus asini ATCC 700915]MCD5028004.1 L-rhamnose mutarotase [Enterococcus asini]MDT2744104.1 L-rhamnose mutarotase [Enterococcus asini]MDT2763893.1 L-rhamnose mutarotase [Enterococcus asini]
MIQKAVRMQIYPGYAAEYQKRHDELWPEMQQMLKDHGAISYRIFLDPETNYLFGFLEIEDEERWSETATTAINQKWWDFMADIMETNPDNSPVAQDLVKVFEL